MGIDDLLQNLLQAFLVHMEIHFQLQEILRQPSVHEPKILRQNFVKNETSQRRLHIAGDHIALRILFGHPHRDAGMQCTIFILISQNSLIHVPEDLALSQCAGPLLGQVIDAQHHVLGGNRHRAAVRRLQKVIGRKQQESAFRLGFHGQRKMHCHLVAVKVRVESGTHQRMQLDCLTFHQNGLKCLDAQPVQRRGAVQHHRMLFDDLLQHIPHLIVHLVYQFLGILDVLADSFRHQLLHHEGLEQLDSHLLGQAALVNLQLRPHHDNGTAGIVHALAQKVLTEPSGLALQHVGQGLQRPVAGPRHGTAPAPIVNQGVHGLLEHPLLVADDDVRRAQLQQPLQAVVPVDDPSV